MKSTLLLFYLLLPALSFAQKKTYTLADMPFIIDSTTGGVVYRGVVEVPGVSADDLYSRARGFINKTFNDARAVTRIDDKAAGVLAGKGILSPQLLTVGEAMRKGGISYNVPFEIRVKDGRFRYELSNMQIMSGNMTVNFDDVVRSSKFDPNHKFTEKEYAKSLKDTEPFTNFIAALKQAMLQKEPGKDF